jgi:hypothetical protein
LEWLPSKKISRANAGDTGDAGISICKMQTAMIAHDLIDSPQGLTCESQWLESLRAVQFAIEYQIERLDACGPLSSRMKIEQLTGEALG